MKLDGPFTSGPDFEHFRRVLTRETREGPVPIVELTVDPEIMAEVMGVDFPRGVLSRIIKSGPQMDPETIQLALRYIDLTIAFHAAVGYDFVTMYPIVPIPRTTFAIKENPRQDGLARYWANEHEGLITSREQFEAFPWPAPGDVGVGIMDYTAPKLAPGQKLLVFVSGIFEDLKLLMGFETMAIKSIEEPDLCVDVLERLTVLCETVVDKAAAHPAAGAVFYAEDMGFNSSTMLNPKWMREHVIPRLARIAAKSHQHNKPFMLHSCGRIDALMDDLIETVGIDARHAYQDNVVKVEEAYKKYGDRIAILGGIDVDLLARGATAQVRARTRQILEACAPRGGYMMGTGNSVTNFCPVENYYAMLDETRKWNQEHT
ncbi:MAG TPA: uroporphyrinogen decarboxylase family protein [bacterium]|nr:uroporphyrinogen decarboxylase family protein [bacterium]